ncbi:MAG: acetate/propionate family kinase [Pirellulaceae bacterium]|nr:acetate/propionate family kinase [Pirellulaceae bacterium]
MNPGSHDADVLLTLNIGSSSIKFAVFSATYETKRFLTGQFDDRDGTFAWTRFCIDGQPTKRHEVEIESCTDESRCEVVLQHIFKLLRSEELDLRAIVHRVVHGGGNYHGPTLIDQNTIETLETFATWAPLHQPECLRAIRQTKQSHPEVPQIACFDTAFHHTMPKEAAEYAIPRYLTERGIRRYGFHGLSFQSVLRQLQELEPRLAKGRVVIAHLGGGSSLCGLQAGQSIGTTMGLTPLDGLPMATRCGSLDPGVVLHLMLGEHMTGEQISQMLYRESGLRGISQTSGDMRTLLASSAVESKNAVLLYAHHVAREIGALFVDLQGLDGLVFTGGIGENSPEIREMVCQRLKSLGIAIASVANAGADRRISDERSAISVWRLHSDEESEMARQAILYVGH